MISERRTEVRYNLRLPVIFHWNDGREQMGEGVTCDIALDGALIASTRFPPLGSDVRIEVLIPAPDRSGTRLRVQCIGKVSRVDEASGNFGVEGSFDDEHITGQATVN